MAGRLKIWNTSTSAWEYTSASFGANTTGVFNEVPGGTVNGTNTAFTTASGYVTNSLRVHSNGIRLKKGGEDYTETGSGFTMVAAPETGTTLTVDYAISNSTYNLGTNNFITNNVPTGLVNSSNTTYTTSSSYVGGTLEVFINGLKQVNGTHFTETTPSTGVFTMSDAPTTGDNITCNYQHNLASTGDADTVDGIHANATATANQLLPLNASSKFPLTTMPTVTHSSTEQLTNEVDYDGYPIYMKTLTGTISLTANTVANIAHNITGLRCITYAHLTVNLSVSSWNGANYFATYQETAGHYLRLISSSSTNMCLLPTYSWGTSIYRINIKYTRTA